jgi:hypothetical protein
MKVIKIILNVTTKNNKKINFLINKKISVIVITTDNENLMKAYRNKLKEIFPILIVILCSVHII